MEFDKNKVKFKIAISKIKEENDIVMENKAKGIFKTIATATVGVVLSTGVVFAGTKVYENIGNFEKLKLRAGDEDPLTWLNNYVAELNKQHKKDSLPIIIQKNPNKIIEKNIQNCFNIGYLFLQDIYYAFLIAHFLQILIFCLFYQYY